jgi:hypothetical protein
MASITTALKNECADAFGDSLDSGFIRIYSGSVPADADTALSGQTQLAELTFAANAFDPASGGVATANAITDGTASATGTATFFRVLQSDGSTVRSQGTVGTSGADMNLNNTSIISGGNVSVTSFTYTVNG